LHRPLRSLGMTPKAEARSLPCKPFSAPVQNDSAVVTRGKQNGQRHLMKRKSGRTVRVALAAAILILCAACGGCGGGHKNVVVVGSKNFPEQALLGEIVAQQIESRTHLRVERRFYLAGSFICQQAMLSGRIDAYVEYTGTALTAILHDPVESDPKAVMGHVRDEYAQRFKFDVMPSLGFDDTFAMVIRGDDARRLGVKTLSQSAKYTPQWRPAFGYEFMERADGYAGLSQAYGLKFATQPRILDLGLLYRALLGKQVDFIAANSTDGLLSARDLTVLEDDKHYFPPYDAVPIVREESEARFPGMREAVADLADQITDADMRKMNYSVVAEQRDVSDVAREFLRAKKLE
jgi:osmoprotectant transport system substrate-binding protein